MPASVIGNAIKNIIQNPKPKTRYVYTKDKFKGVNITKKWCPEKTIGSSAHFIYDFICLRDALKKDFDVIFEFGYQSVAISFILLSIKDSIIITNMDGLEWKRKK